MNLRQKYKKAKQKIKRLENQTVRPGLINSTPYDVKTLRVTRELDPRFDPKYLRYIDSITSTISDFMIKDMSEELKRYWDFETIEDHETGVIKFIGTVKILVDKEKKERE